MTETPQKRSITLHHCTTLKPTPSNNTFLEVLRLLFCRWPKIWPHVSYRSLRFIWQSRSSDIICFVPSNFHAFYFGLSRHPHIAQFATWDMVFGLFKCFSYIFKPLYKTFSRTLRCNLKGSNRSHYVPSALKILPYYPAYKHTCLYRT